MLFCQHRQADQGSCRALPAKIASLPARLVAVFAIFLTIGTTSADFGDQSMGWTKEQEAAVAGYLSRRLQGQGVVINDVWLEYWLAERGRHLRQATSVTLGPVYIAQIKDPNFNAFALPGNVMGFNLGLWRTAHTEAEFMSVVAHEMAHLGLRHFNRLSESNRRQAWLSISGALLGIALAGTNPDLAGATFVGAQAGAMQKSLAFSRAMETEADGVATDLLQKVGYPADAGARVFQRMQQEVTHNPDASDYWQTHPRSSSRVARISLPRSRDRESAKDTPDNHYNVMRWYVNQRYLPKDDFTRMPDNLQQPIPENGGQLPAQLLAKPDPNLIYGWIWHQGSSSRGETTRQRLIALTDLFPDFDPAWYRLATLAESSENNAQQHCTEALAYLDQIDATYLQVLELRRRLTANCQPQREAEATAQWLWHKGEETKAITVLRRAIETPGSASQIARSRELLAHFEQQQVLLPQ